MISPISSWQISDEPRRNASDKCPWRNVLGHDCSCCDDTAFAETHALEHHRAGTHPHLVLDMDRAPCNVRPVLASVHPVRDITTAVGEVQRVRIVIDKKCAESDEDVVLDDDLDGCVEQASAPEMRAITDLDSSSRGLEDNRAPNVAGFADHQPTIRTVTDHERRTRQTGP